MLTAAPLSPLSTEVVDALKRANAWDYLTLQRFNALTLMDWQPLDFERSIFELDRRLEDLKNHSDKHDVDLDPAIKDLEAKLRETRRSVYGNLTAWQRVQIARHTQRPFALDYVDRCFTNWVELHGDRRFADDRAMPCGLALLDGQRCVVITHQKGRNTKENVMRNFGCAHPEGYRKALRLMRLGEKFGMPVISLIDTPGAFPGVGSEERHISEAIAVNLREMMRLRAPIVAAVIGEGGSAAEALKLTAQDLLKLEVVDEIVPEPEGGAHRDYDSVAANVGRALRRALQQVSRVPIAELLEKRYQKFRRLGVFSEGKTVTASARS